MTGSGRKEIRAGCDHGPPRFHNTMQIEHVPVTSLVLNLDSARRFSKLDERTARQIIEAQGVRQPLVIGSGNVQTNYRKVSLWSEGTTRNAYVASVQASNPDSPLARLPRTTVVETRVKSVSPLAANSALIRFDTIRRDADGRPQAPQPWVAVIRYRYSGAPMSLEDRFINPLGFEVLHYQRNAEALATPEAAPAGTVQ